MHTSDPALLKRGAIFDPPNARYLNNNLISTVVT